MPDSIPSISGEAMAKIDKIMMQEMGVDTLQLMELAGFGVADMVRSHCGLDLSTQPRIVALAGTGGNGGDAMVATRLLCAWGAKVTVVLSRTRSGFSGVTAHQLEIIDRMGITVMEPENSDLPPADLIVDGLLGFSLQGDPRGEAARLIMLANAHPSSILAIDIPSGLNATSGEVGEPCIAASCTVTLALPKTGLTSAPDYIPGEIWLADIGVSSDIYDQIGVKVDHDIFAHASLLKLR